MNLFPQVFPGVFQFCKKIGPDENSQTHINGYARGWPHWCTMESHFDELKLEGELGARSGSRIGILVAMWRVNDVILNPNAFPVDSRCEQMARYATSMASSLRISFNTQIFKLPVSARCKCCI